MSKFTTAEILSKFIKMSSGDYTFRFDCLQGESYKMFLFIFPRQDGKFNYYCKKGCWRKWRNAFVTIYAQKCDSFMRATTIDGVTLCWWSFVTTLFHQVSVYTNRRLETGAGCHDNWVQHHYAKKTSVNMYMQFIQLISNGNRPEIVFWDLPYLFIESPLKNWKCKMLRGHARPVVIPSKFSRLRDVDLSESVFYLVCYLFYFESCT